MSCLAEIRARIVIEEDTKTNVKQYFGVFEYSDSLGRKSDFKSEPFTSFFAAEQFLDSARPVILKNFAAAGATLEGEYFENKVIH